MPILGGIQTVTSQLAKGLVSKGYDVTVITNLYPKGLRVTEKIDGVQIYRLPFVSGGTVRDKFIQKLTSFCLSSILSVKRPEAVYVHFPLAQASYILRMKKKFKFKIITCFHGHDVLRYDEGYSLDSDIYHDQKALISASSVVTACSDYLSDAVRRIFNFSEVSTIYNGVNLERFNSNGALNLDSPYLFSFGRLETIKGFEILIDAFSKAVLPNEIKLLIAGDGSLKDKLQSEIDDKGLVERVTLIGRLSPNDIVKYSMGAKAIVIPSLRESFGIVALEAIAAKRPIVATNRGGLPEILDSRFGILCDPESSDMAKAIEQICSGKMSFDFSSADDYLSKFTVEQMVDNYLATL